MAISSVLAGVHTSQRKRDERDRIFLPSELPFYWARDKENT
jgi:hypothetical protein